MLREVLIYITGADIINSVTEKNNKVYERYLGYHSSFDAPWDLPWSGMNEVYFNRFVGMIKYPLAMSLRWSGVDLLAKVAQKVLRR